MSEDRKHWSYFDIVSTRIEWYWKGRLTGSLWGYAVGLASGLFVYLWNYHP
jgi:hypothetical protein